MANQWLVNTNLWKDPYIRGLNSRGKLALFYALDRVGAGESVIIEDMALHTGLESSEVCDWLTIFIQHGKLARNAVAGQSL